MQIWKRKFLRNIYEGKKVKKTQNTRTTKKLRTLCKNADIIEIVKSQKIR